MISQEEQMLNSLVERVNSTKLSEKDPEAETLLQRGFSGNPDAVYILAQSVLVQNIALDQARAQLSQAQAQVQQLQQQQAQQPAKSTSFLGSLLGHRDPAPPPPPAQLAYQPAYTPQGAPQYQTPYNPAPPPPPPYQGAPYGGPAYGGPQYAPPQQPSFLRGAAQTAAGVAAGALAFEGVESLLHGGFGGGGMGMGGFGGGGMGMGGMGMGGGFERPVEETVVNNYYDAPGSGGEDRGDYGRDFDRGGEHHDSGGAQFQDASWNENPPGGFDNVGDSGGSFDSASTFDDSSSFGDSGGGFGDDNSGSGGDSSGF